MPSDGETVGEVVARGDVVMDGYWKRPSDSLNAMQGGWFHTGDLATVDSDRYVLIVDRKKDIIISGGENISSLEVEKVLVAHAAVYEAVVIPVPDEKWGEVPRALVVRKPGTRTSPKRNWWSSVVRGWRTSSALSPWTLSTVFPKPARVRF